MSSLPVPLSAVPSRYHELKSQPIALSAFVHDVGLVKLWHVTSISMVGIVQETSGQLVEQKAGSSSGQHVAVPPCVSLQKFQSIT
jgi:hypothetical protein